MKRTPVKMMKSCCSAFLLAVMDYLVTERCMELIGQSSQRVMQQSNFSAGLCKFLSKLQLCCTGPRPCGFQLLLQSPVLKPAPHVQLGQLLCNIHTETPSCQPDKFNLGSTQHFSRAVTKGPALSANNIKYLMSYIVNRS